MVCSVNQVFGRASRGQTIPNLALPMLRSAHAALDADDLLRAAIQCREAITRHLRALCELHELQIRSRHPTAGEYSKALRKAKIFGSFWADVMRDVLGTGNRAAHAQAITRGAVCFMLEMTWELLEHFPTFNLYREGGAL